MVGAPSAADTRSPRSGMDTLTGGTDNDAYILNDASEVVVECGRRYGHYPDGLHSFDSGLDEYRESSDTGDFKGTGNGSANVITGSSGNNTLDGGAWRWQ